MSNLSKEHAGGLVLSASAPTAVQTYRDCETAIGWLRTKALFDKAVDAAHAAAVKAAHAAHRAAIAARDNLKKPSNEAAEQVRAMVEAYAEKESNPLPAGVYRRKVYQVMVRDRDKVPAQYLCPDLRQIEAVVKATEGAVEIPGIEVVVETAVTVRAEAEGD